MDRSVYIVANKQQEREVLLELVRKGYEHPGTDTKKYTFTPSIDGTYFSGFPYKIISDNDKHLIYWSSGCFYSENNEVIVFDGRNTNDKNSR